VGATRGPLAQLVAHLHDAQGVTGSSPVRPTKKFLVRGGAIALTVLTRAKLSTICQRRSRWSFVAAPGDDINDARRERLARGIAEDLETQTYAQAMVADFDDVEEWRAAARMAGRIVEWRVRTTVPYGTVYVRAIDVPTPEWVRERSQRQLADRTRRLLGPMS
jgi:hypothetical protein